MAEITQTPSFEAVKEAAEELLRLSSLPVGKYKARSKSLDFSQVQQRVAREVVTLWKPSLDYLPENAPFARLVTWLASRKNSIKVLIDGQLALYFDAFMLGVVRRRSAV